LALLPYRSCPHLPVRRRRSTSLAIRAGARSSIRTPIARTTAAEIPTRAMAGGERNIVTTAIAITAAIGADASGRAYPDSIGVNQESRGTQASRLRSGYAAGARGGLVTARARIIPIAKMLIGETEAMRLMGKRRLLHRAALSSAQCQRDYWQSRCWPSAPRNVVPGVQTRLLRCA
jgi:hypothetical protein